MSNLLKKKIELLIKSFVLLIFTASVVNAQEKKEVVSIQNIYLHTDRDNYTLGESLWYKAYSVSPYNNQLYNKSNVLYVELVSPDAKVIARHNTRLENGLGHGDFKLTDSIGVKKAGIYQIRAYTNWNRNFEGDFVFEKNIKILNIFSSAEPNDQVVTRKQKQEKIDIEETKENFNIQFFPEGGSLVEDVINVVAFKALDSNGMPIEVKGEIYDATDALVTFFQTSHDGMGRFQLKPKNGNSYYAKTSSVEGDGVIKTSLPKARDEGYVLSYKKVKGSDTEVLIVKTNNKTLLSQQNQDIKVVCKIKGLTYLEISQPISSQIVKLELPKAKLPSGINQVTLFDASSRPQSERLIFIDKNDELDIVLSTDKTLYKPNEKVTVSLSSKTKTGAPVLASYSLSSIDMNGLEDKDLGTNICSYYLLESDIRGKVHHPGFYFDNNNPRRIEKLDLLLLTQGWRNFLWKDTLKLKDGKVSFFSEKGINLSGRLTQIIGNKGKVDNHITLTLFNNGGVNMLNTETDSLGRFKFQDLMFYGTSQMILSSKNDKGKSKGALYLDEVSKSPLAVNFKSQPVKRDTLKTNVIKENILRKHVSFGITPENVLDEIEIVAKKKEEPISMYGTADRTFVFDGESETFSTIYELIQANIPGVLVDETSIKFLRNVGPALLIVDGIQWQPEDVAFIQPADVAKIETLNGASATILGSNGGNGAILIYLKKGTINNEKIVLQTIKQDLEGFYEPRVFYAPKPESVSSENQNEAIRNTLYWNPYMHPDKTGVAQANYYNSAVETKVKVTIEGITVSGVPVVARTHYIVEK